MSGKPENSAVKTNGKLSGGAISSREMKSKSSYHDKESGSYGRVTTKDLVSSGDYVNRGKTGFKDECKASATVRVGDKSGYTEYSKEERLTSVKYDGSISSSRGIKGDSCGRSITTGCKGYNGGHDAGGGFGGGGGGGCGGGGEDDDQSIDDGDADDYDSSDDDGSHDDSDDDDGSHDADDDSNCDGSADDNDSYDDGSADDYDSYDDGSADDYDSYDD